jgi:hypothetical protein
MENIVEKLEYRFHGYVHLYYSLIKGEIFLIRLNLSD